MRKHREVVDEEGERRGRKEEEAGRRMRSSSQKKKTTRKMKWQGHEKVDKSTRWDTKVRPGLWSGWNQNISHHA